MVLSLETTMLLDAMRRTMLVVSCVTALLVTIDSIAVLMNYPEKPPHKPRSNAASWLIISLTTGVTLGYLLFMRHDWVGEDSPADAKAAILIFYFGIASGFTARAITRAPRPWLTVSAVVLMSVVGTILALLEPIP